MKIIKSIKNFFASIDRKMREIYEYDLFEIRVRDELENSSNEEEFLVPMEKYHSLVASLIFKHASGSIVIIPNDWDDTYFCKRNLRYLKKILNRKWSNSGISIFLRKELAPIPPLIKKGVVQGQVTSRIISDEQVLL